MRVLVTGSGGREHALCWKFAEEGAEVVCMPGNAGIAAVALCVPGDACAPDEVLAVVREHDIDLVVVGAEQPLSAGLVDALEAQGVRAFGPHRLAARLENSKVFSKRLCVQAGVPTAPYESFETWEEARRYSAQLGYPQVIKFDGLAAGKGVVIAHDAETAEQALRSMLVERSFGAGAVIVEGFLEGHELSVFALCDGEDFVPLGSAQDYKTVGEGNTGANTGGMGAQSPSALMTPELKAQVEATVLRPILAAMVSEGCPYRGVLYCGLMVTQAGVQVLEFNCRFGDPECQVLMLRLRSPLLPTLEATLEGRLQDVELSWDEGVALTVVLAAQGYPGSYERGALLNEPARLDEGIQVFHAGTGRDAEGRLINTGGRVLNVCAQAATLAEARERAYRAADRIVWPQGFCRRDIGADG